MSDRKRRLGESEEDDRKSKRQMNTSPSSPNDQAQYVDRNATDEDVTMTDAPAPLPEPPASAVDQTLVITELREMILQALPARDLYRAQRINSLFRGSVQKSPALQQEMFRRPAGKLKKGMKPKWNVELFNSDNTFPYGAWSRRKIKEVIDMWCSIVDGDNAEDDVVLRCTVDMVDRRTAIQMLEWLRTPSSMHGMLFCRHTAPIQLRLSFIYLRHFRGIPFNLLAPDAHWAFPVGRYTEVCVELDPLTTFGDIVSIAAKIALQYDTLPGEVFDRLDGEWSAETAVDLGDAVQFTENELDCMTSMITEAS